MTFIIALGILAAGPFLIATYILVGLWLNDVTPLALYYWLLAPLGYGLIWLLIAWFGAGAIKAIGRRETPRDDHLPKIGGRS